MFEDWKRAWRDAVANFQYELHAEEDGTYAHHDALRRELATARGALSRLDTEIARTRQAAAAERDSELVCRRREGMANGIGDQETVRVAAEYAVRHAERAGVLERKVEVLEAERHLLERDIAAMEQAVATAPPPPAGSVSGSTLLDDDEEQERERRELQRLRRERAAEERLEELKRRMR